jgi:ribosome-binding factor A
MTSNRPERVAQLLQREVTGILSRDFRDPRLAGITVTDTEVTGDLKLATVYVSTLQEGKDREETLKALRRAAGAVRHQLASRMSLREVPEVRFEFDDSIEKGARVEEILRRLKTGEPVEDDEETW